jgi:hypothetical protein
MVCRVFSHTVAATADCEHEQCSGCAKAMGDASVRARAALFVLQKKDANQNKKVPFCQMIT